MLATLFFAALASATAAQAADSFAVNTPVLVQCKEAKISWQATKGPYNVIIVPSEIPCGDIYSDAGETSETWLTWKADVPAGLDVQVSVEDIDGNEAWSGIIKVGASSDASCVSAELAALAPMTAAAGVKALSAPGSSSALGSSSASAPTVAATSTPGTTGTTGTGTGITATTGDDDKTVLQPVGAAAGGIVGNINNGASPVQSTFVALAGAFAVITASML